MKTTPTRHEGMKPAGDTFMKTRAALWVGLTISLLLGGMGSASAAMLADFNDAATWSTGWTFANWGNGMYRTTEDTYEGAGSMVVYYAYHEWNEVYLDFTAQNWSNQSTLSIAAKTQSGTGSFFVRLSGTGLSYDFSSVNITSSWTDFTFDLSKLNNTQKASVTEVKLCFYGPSDYPYIFDALEVVPEPASLGLLTLGGLVLLRRRR